MRFDVLVVAFTQLSPQNCQGLDILEISHPRHETESTENKKLNYMLQEMSHVG